MRNLCLILFTVGLLSACSGSSDETSNFPLPRELQDCNIYAVGNGWTTIHVVRCHKERCTTTSKLEGKVRKSVTTCEVE